MSVVLVRDRSGCAAGDASETQLQMVARDDPLAESCSTGFVERRVIEEVAVLVRELVDVHWSGSFFAATSETGWWSVDSGGGHAER